MHLDNINHVAIYLRKSRDEEKNDVLFKHRKELIEFVEKNNWTYDIYEEIGTSQSIEFRPQFSRLLEKIRENKYDAVVVTDFDRITRGEMYEYGIIQKIFTESNTLIITPHEVIDMSDETKTIHNDLKAVLGRYEYEQIKKRMQDGKIRSAKLGFWPNGIPPLGYDYDKNTKKLVINEKEAEIIRLIFKLYLSGMPMFKIAFELNKKGFRTKKGSYFQDATIDRILTNQAYIGNIVYGKSEGSGHKNRKTKPLKFKDKDEWIVTENAHPPIIDKEDFLKVQRMREKRRKVPTKARSGRFALSGLLFCGKCKKSLRFKRKILKKKGEVTYIIRCDKTDPFGNRCGNEGCELNLVLEKIKEIVLNEYKQLKDSIDMDKVNRISEQLKMELDFANNELDRLRNGEQRIMDLFIEGYIDKNERDKRLKEQRNKIKKAEKQLNDLREEYQRVTEENDEERLKRLNEFRNQFNLNLNDHDMNEALKKVIRKIYYKKEGNQIHLDIIFN